MAVISLDLSSTATCPKVKEASRPLELEREFRLRLAQASRERRDQQVEALRARYAPKMDALREQIGREGAQQAEIHEVGKSRRQNGQARERGKRGHRWRQPPRLVDHE